MYVLGLSESGIITIGLGLLTLFTTLMGVFLRVKQKADTADTMNTVDKKIDKKLDEKIEPIEKRMNRHDSEFREFKKDEIGPMKETLQQLDKSNALIGQKMDDMLKGLDDFKDLIIESHKTLHHRIDSKKDKDS